MSLIKCHECGNEVSTEAAACQKCGAKPKAQAVPQKKSPAIEMFVGVSILAFFLWIIFSPDKENQRSQEGVKATEQSSTTNPAQTPAPQAPAANPIKAEDIVKFPKSNIACLTKEGLGQIIAYGVNGEATKLQSMMVAPENEEGQCIMLDPSAKYKVIHVEYNDPEHPDMGIAEVVGMKIKSSAHGAWVLTMTAERVQ